MGGVITSWDVLSHPIATARCFGWQILFRALIPWHRQPFLSLLRDAGFFGFTTPAATPILERCIALELRAKRIYQFLAATFAADAPAGQFLAGLVEQEQQHADLLCVCRAAALRSNWKAPLFNPWQDYLPRLEQQMQAAEASLHEIRSLEDALHLVIRIESSEINQVFQAALAATDAAFVRRLKPFREVMVAHMNHIIDRIAELAPQMLPACRELRATFLRRRS